MAQRSRHSVAPCVRHCCKEFPERGHILELGGGTGEDAAFLAESRLRRTSDRSFTHDGRTGESQIISIWFTGSNRSRRRVGGFRLPSSCQWRRTFRRRILQLCTIELCHRPRHRWHADSHSCSSLAAAAMLVVFGTSCPGEMLTELLHKRPRPGASSLSSAARYQRGFPSVNSPIVYHRRTRLWPEPLRRGLCWKSALESA